MCQNQADIDLILAVDTTAILALDMFTRACLRGILYQ